MTSPALRATLLGLVAAASLFPLSGRLAAAPIGQCVPPQAVVAQAMGSVPGAMMTAIYKEAEAQSLVDLFNAVEPRTDYLADFVAIVSAEGVPAVFLVAFNKDGCVVFADSMPLPMYERWKGKPA